MDMRKSYLFASAAIAIISCQSWAAYAQTAEGAGGALPQRVEDQSDSDLTRNIVVTGSRLRSPTLTSPSPLQVIDQQSIKREAFINVLDAIQLNPTFGNPGNSRTSSNGSRSGTGSSQIGLRNAGPGLTLTLIDGRRMVSNDVGFIPTGFVDRIEVLTGGASAVYGSDALAGVVNFIFKKDYNGLQANVQAGLSERGDNGEYQADLTLGRNFADGRGNALFYVGWSKQELVSAANRDFSAGGFTSLGTTQRRGTRDDNNLIAAQNLFVPVPIYSQTTPAGLFTAGGRNFTVGADGMARPPLASETFNGAPFGALANPLQRLNSAARINYELNDNINLFAQGTYARTTTTAYLNPLGLVSGGGLGVFGNGGVYNIESYITSQAGTTSKVRNAFVPDAIFNAATDTNRDGLRDISFSKRLSDYGGFTSRQERETYQVTVGAEGDLGSDWRYEAWYSYGVARANQNGSGVVNADRYAQALEAVRDINDFDRDGDVSEVICASAVARAAGCVPANIFGEGRLSSDAIAYTRGTVLRDSRQTLSDFSANINGPLFQLWPAGPVQIAAGIEHRRETSSEIFDPIANAGRNGYAQQTNTAGAITIKEAYGELQVPLLANIPFFHNLTARGAARASKYSQLTRTFIGYNVGFEYAPVRDIRFRGVYARAIRAPGISELFRPAQVTIDTVADPCLGVTLTSADATSVNCRRDASVVANINANGGVFSLNTQDRGASVTTLTVPNPDLKEQYAITQTLGAVINPVSINALRNLTVTGDYYKLKITGGFGANNVSTTANLCYVQGFDQFCDQIIRRTTPVGPYSVGSIDQFRGQLVNGTGVRIVEGLDFSMSYFTTLDNVGINGRLSVSGSYSHLLRSYTTPTAGAAKRNLKGELGTPSDPASGTISFDTKSFGFSVTGQYVSAAYLEEPFRANYLMADGTPVDRKYFKIPHYFYTNVQLRVNAGEKYQMFFGIKNLTDTQPFVLYAGLPGNGYTYDPFGRRFYAGVRVTM
ncbi:TonB-dependent receptor domain-containing protein [Sphingobium aromaticiconvertens]|uniref:TonB-dependent receptor domain-containing protein n=1 Tax=Sphingobium aromaticiconvertens TaxID=365341 RepID=UPI0030175699